MLALPIKKKWFDMIASGEKKEEYREIKPYYKSRLINYGMLDQYGLPTLLQSQILLRNGYRSDSPYIIIKAELDIREGRTEWGAEEGKEYYVLKIKEIIK